ncbi:uncharacterized protein Gasu_34700 [Galdieria sulphuraria]|uniref:Uncharacterized protein n=1 Tax=Galdieria sulphuraria TaxID=130081 RepID=M2XZK2_GALSU|nr:uncharacterized protein Gasu_34700 [Galdieria sulphuraria]EME29078.1 hypothetical protein Gasu_34700 [Galdieria sulphuraria]|eukprot:XP_005705598.1 hypothetical protein Gasu_34700 [Galdieria sulphuraria]
MRCKKNNSKYFWRDERERETHISLANHCYSSFVLNRHRRSDSCRSAWIVMGVWFTCSNNQLENFNSASGTTLQTLETFREQIM